MNVFFEQMQSLKRRALGATSVNSLRIFVVSLLVAICTPPLSAANVGDDFSSKFTSWSGNTGICSATYVGSAGNPENFKGKGALVTGDVLYSDITGLPAGFYKVQFKAIASTTGNRDNFDIKVGYGLTYVFANDRYVYIPVVSRTAVTSDIFDNNSQTLEVEVKGDGKLRIGVHNDIQAANWLVVSKDVQITYLGTTHEFADNSISGSTFPWFNLTSEVNAGTIQFKKEGTWSDWNVELQYSNDPYEEDSWTDMPLYSDHNATLYTEKGSPVFFRAKDTNVNFSKDNSKYFRFILGDKASGQTAQFQANGSVMSLLAKTGFENNQTLSNTSGNLFSRLFKDQTRLYSAPNLPATTLTAYCYEYMFEGCSHLEEAPRLPASTLANYCYRNMFQGCSSLASAPALPAKTLVTACYNNMFLNCSSMNYISVGFSSTSTSYTNTWMKGVAATGLFSCPAGNTIPKNSESGIPSGWTEDVKKVDLDYLCFTATDDNTVYVSLVPEGNPSNQSSVQLEYSKDKLNWEDFKLGQRKANVELLSNNGLRNIWNAYVNHNLAGIPTNGLGCSLENGESIYIRAKARGGQEKDKGANDSFSQASGYYHFTVFVAKDNTTTAGVDISGNIMSLLDAQCLQTEVPAYAFRNLFKAKDSAPLTTPIKVFGITLGNVEFKSIADAFHAAPELPATELQTACYESMFEGCAHLNSAPVLPARELAVDCYKNMFKGCTNIHYMRVGFSDWGVVDEDGIPVVNTPTLAWTDGIGGTGTFVCPAALELKYNSDLGCSDYIPWKPADDANNKVELIQESNDYLCFSVNTTVATIRLNKTAADLNNLTNKLEYSFTPWDETSGSWVTYQWDGTQGDLITLDRKANKYRVYFRNKTTDNSGKTSESGKNYRFVMTGSIDASGNINSLLKKDCDVAQLPARAYQTLFLNCTSLKTAPKLPSLRLGDYCYDGMFRGSGITTTPELPATVMKTACYQAMFERCYDLTNAPQLSSLFLAHSCYKYMFRDCTKLTTAPELPATELAQNCYEQMFAGCTNLSYIKVGFTTWDADVKKHTLNWVSPCIAGTTGDHAKTSLHTTDFSGSGVFVASSNLESTVGVSWIPEGWTFIREGGNNDYLCFSALRNGSRVSIRKTNSPAEVKLVYSTDEGRTWNNYTSWGTDIVLNTSGDNQRVYFRAGQVANNGDAVVIPATNGAFRDSNGYYKFYSKVGSFAVSGNIMSLLSTDCSANEVPYRGFELLFDGCSTITSAPNLPATTLNNRCYLHMFQNCTNLAEAPELHASKLASDCYQGMFYGCTKLTQAPALNSLDLASGCYAKMFYDCINLTHAPELPATDLKDNCYKEMFKGCRKLNRIKVGFTSWGKNNTQYTQNWAANCDNQASSTAHTAHTFSPSGTFVAPKELKLIESQSNVPLGWVFNPHALCLTAPSQANIQLNKYGSPDAVSLVYSKDYATWTDYSWDGDEGDVIRLGKGESVYFKAKTRNATFSKSNNYYYFVSDGIVAASGNVMSLIDDNDDNMTIPNSGCFFGLFKNCANLTTAPELPAMNLQNSCYESMFSGCSSLEVAPELPAKEMMLRCYASMFQGCSSLTESPFLAGKTLASGCFDHMFANCVNMSKITVAFESWTSPSGADATGAWVQNVSEVGIFIGPGALPKTRNSNVTPNNDIGKYIPYKWIVPVDLCFTNEQYNSYVSLVYIKNGVSSSDLKQYGNNGKSSFRYSFDGVTFHDYTPGTRIHLLNVGETVYFKYGGSGADAMYKDANNYYRFVIDGKVAATGNIGSMAFNNYNNNWISDKYMFRSLFEGCEGLTRLPDLPTQNNPDEGFYMNLFKGCKSATNTPSSYSNWKDAKAYAFEGMFDGCESITDAPEIPRPNNMQNGLYKNMFRGCKSLVNPPSTLNFNVMKESCYEGMFEGCESLTKIPTFYEGDTWNNYTMAKACFKNMFKDCISLDVIPQINTKAVAESCFEGMFQGCSSLTHTPILGASTMAKNCYKNMFKDCTSLLSAPELPATTMAESCYAYMFSGCSKLKHIEVGFNAWYVEAGDAQNLHATDHWVEGVAKEGTFMCPDGLIKRYDSSHIPYNDSYRWDFADNGDYLCFTLINSGWTDLRLVKNGNPTIITYKYSYDRETWTTVVGETYAQLMGDKHAGDKVYIKISNGALSTSASDYWSFTVDKPVSVSGNIMSMLDGSMVSDEVPAYSFYKLFSGMGANLTDISDLKLPATTVGDYAYANMFDGCTYLKNNATTAPELPATTLGKNCYKELFKDWKKLAKAPELPAVTLAEGCYYSMFQGCTSLTKAPVLPAKVYVKDSYRGMFNGCSQLNYLNVAFKNWPSSDTDIQNWVNGVANSGELICPWELLQGAVTKWGSDNNFANVYGGSKVPKNSENRWAILLKTEMSMDYANGVLNLGGGSEYWLSTDPALAYNNLVGEHLTGGVSSKDLSDWLKGAAVLDSITYYALAINGSSSLATPTPNSLTIYRLPRQAGYCVAEDTRSIEEALYYASKVSSSSYPVKIFVSDGTYQLTKTSVVGDWVSLVGESIENTKLLSGKAEGALKISGKNAYVQDMTISNAKGEVAFEDWGNQTTTLHVAMGAGNVYMSKGEFDVRHARVPEWNRSTDPTQIIIESVSINGNTLSINTDKEASAYLIRIGGGGFALVRSNDLYILREMHGDDLYVRAANNRGAFGDPCDTFIESEEDGTEYAPLHEKVKLNAYGYASFSYDDSDPDWATLRLHGASAYVAHYYAVYNSVVLSHINEYDYIPKGTGVILFGSPNTYVKFYQMTDEEKAQMPEYNASLNDLVANTEGVLTHGTNLNSKYGSSGCIYVLSGKEVKYLNPGGTVGKNKAYLDLPIPAAHAASAMRISFGLFDFEEENLLDETGISEIREADLQDENIYNLHGQRTNQKSGLMIKNGKVIMVK